MRLALAVAVLVVAVGPARAERCAVRYLSDARSVDMPDVVVKKGTTDREGISTIRVDRKSGLMAYCFHGGYCFPASAMEFTTACNIVPDSPQHDSEIFLYSPK